MRANLVFMVLGALAFGGGSVAARPFGHPNPHSHRQQLINCMNKRMSASRTISYNEATKVCKAQLLAAQSATLAAVSGKNAGGFGR
jgi:hypothetical protein